MSDSKSSKQESVRLGTHDEDDKSISPEQSLSQEAKDNVRSSEVPVRSSRPFVGRPARPVPSRNQAITSRQRLSNIQRGRSRSRSPITVTSPRPSSSSESVFEPREPEQPASPVQSSRVLSTEALAQALVPSPTTDTQFAGTPFVQPRRKEPAVRPPVQRVRPQANPFDKIVAEKSAPSRNRNIAKPIGESVPIQPAGEVEFEYEYYYDYLDDDHDKPNSDYDLVPLANKVCLIFRTANQKRTSSNFSGQNSGRWTSSLLGCWRLSPSIFVQKICQLFQKPRNWYSGINIPVSVIFSI